jgi:ABC-type branched-subunit amino acid transport system ATPase component/2-polyprenyl-6-methoxyphenol hydroxylase-like FAD-dependent oxidoreductase
MLAPDVATDRTPETERAFDVLVVGAGPVGLTTALMLGRRNWRVAVVERWPSPYPRPRAVHFDGEIARLLAATGIGPALADVTEFAGMYEWRNAAGATLIHFDWSLASPYGWPAANMFNQPSLERALEDAVNAQATVEIFRGYQAVELLERDDSVQLIAQGPTGQQAFRAAYVVGCDGANSFVRSRMATKMNDLGFFYDWLIVDVIPHEQRVWDPQNLQICDPKRPTTLVSGGPGRRRWEFMRMPGETIEELNNEDAAWRLLAPWNITRDNTTLERHAVYTFAASWAQQWRDGRVLIAGDAAHLMPPFAGQGMCSGIRDASNLTWKLDLVMRGLAADAILDSYGLERGAHVQHAIGMSVELGKVICVTDPGAVAERDAFMLSKGGDPFRGRHACSGFRIVKSSTTRHVRGPDGIARRRRGTGPSSARARRSRRHTFRAASRVLTRDRCARLTRDPCRDRRPIARRHRRRGQYNPGLCRARFARGSRAAGQLHIRDRRRLGRNRSARGRLRAAARLRRGSRERGVARARRSQLSSAPPSPVTPVLRVVDVTKRYGKTVALEGVTLEIAPRETLGIIGPNGAGKSTLLGSIAGQLRPDSGSVWLGNVRLDRASPHVAARCGVVLAHQIPRPFSRLTVRQNLRVASLAAAARSGGVNRHDDVERVLEESGLSDKAERLARDVTLLDRKRLGLARAMVVRPSLLLLDEVAAGLTLGEVGQLVALIVRLRESGTAIALVEHVDNVIRELASRVVVLDWGRIIAEGTPAQIAANERVREVYLGSRTASAERAAASEDSAPERRPEALLEIRGVTARYNGPPALRNVDVSVRRGEIVAVLGANGAGKTTLARLISGVLQPMQGAIVFGGENISTVPPHRRANLGIAGSPEGRRIFSTLTVEENLRIGSYTARARASAQETLTWIYDVFPVLRERARRFGNELSGGQQQMLAIGRALMASPRLLVLDEASLGLAPVVIDTIYGAIGKIRERDVSIVLVEQAAYRALAVADYVYILDHGTLAFAGTARELRNEAVLAQAYFGAA